MAARTWDTDFRFAAIQASIRCLADQRPDDPFSCDGSFCVPVAKRPVLGWTPGRISLIALSAGFALLGGGAFLASWAEKNQAGGSALLAFAVCCSLSGIVLFFLPAKFDRQIISWLIGDRGRALMEQAGLAGIMSAELSNAEQKDMKLSIDGDDHVLIFPDHAGRRLMIEGIGARYQIRADDVVVLRPFRFMNYVGAEVVCQIDDDTQFRFAVARVSLLAELIRQLPFLFFLRGKIRNRLLDRCEEVLQPEIVEVV
ncbi:MAG: hypothetical protein RIK87_30335 [Fuerstiella sp.]